MKLFRASRKQLRVTVPLQVISAIVVYKLASQGKHCVVRKSSFAKTLKIVSAFLRKIVEGPHVDGAGVTKVFVPGAQTSGGLWHVHALVLQLLSDDCNRSSPSDSGVYMHLSSPIVSYNCSFSVS